MSTMIFLPLMFIDPKELKQGLPPDQQEDELCVYNYFAEALPRAVDGYPVFMEMRVISATTVARAYELLKEMEAKLAEVAEDTSGEPSSSARDVRED